MQHAEALLERWHTGGMLAACTRTELSSCRPANRCSTAPSYGIAGTTQGLTMGKDADRLCDHSTSSLQHETCGWC